MVERPGGALGSLTHFRRIHAHEDRSLCVRRAVDALDPVLGRTVATRSWHPRDGRITEFAMHLSVDLSLRYDVELCILAEPARQT
jgi:hypothetical protein